MTILRLNNFKLIIVSITVAFIVNSCVRSQYGSGSENDNWNTSELAEGIEWHKTLGQDHRFESKQSYNALEVDLQSADIDIEFLWFYDRTAILRMVANQVGAIAAINGTYLEKGTQYFKSQDSVYQRIANLKNHPGYWMREGAVFAIEPDQRYGIDFTTISELERMTYPDIISGGPILVDNNQPVGLTLLERPHTTHEKDRHPRTAIGVSDEGKRLIFFTVDGRAKESEGLTIPELTEVLYKDFSVSDALNLDGGGTTTMWIREQTSSGVVNYPSGNGKFDHYGERWTGQAIVIFPNDSKNEITNVSDERCTAVFSGQNSETDEQYIYLGDQVDGLMDMPADQDFAISLWINPELNEKQNLTLFNKRIPEDENPEYRRGYEAYLTSDGYPVTILDTGEKQIQLKGEEQIKGGTWSHLTLTLNGEQAQLYVNGQIVAEETEQDLKGGFANKFFLTAGAQRNWTPNLIEKHTYPYSPWGTPKFTFTDNPYAGEMDEFQVWHRALNASEIQTLAQQRLGGNSLPINKEGLLSYWRFDEVERDLALDDMGNIHGTYMGNIKNRCE